jgi:hypothetical protein
MRLKDTSLKIWQRVETIILVLEHACGHVCWWSKSTYAKIKLVIKYQFINHRSTWRTYWLTTRELSQSCKKMELLKKLICEFSHRIWMQIIEWKHSVWKFGRISPPHWGNPMNNCHDQSNNQLTSRPSLYRNSSRWVGRSSAWCAKQTNVSEKQIVKPILQRNIICQWIFIWSIKLNDGFTVGNIKDE